MGNWIDELDKDTKEYDRKVREGAKKYDEEVGKWWTLDNAESDEDEPDEDED